MSPHKAIARGLPARRGRNLLSRYHVKQKSGAKKSAFRPSCDIVEVVDFSKGCGLAEPKAAGMAEAARERGLGWVKWRALAA